MTTDPVTTAHLVTPAIRFLWGTVGSVAIELISAYRRYQPENHSLPSEYSDWKFYIIRSLVAIMAGLMAIAYEVTSALAAVGVGASAPLLIEALARTGAKTKGCAGRK